MIRRLMAAAVVSAFASGTTMGASTPALKPIDPAARKSMIDAGGGGADVRPMACFDPLQRSMTRGRKAR
jgi:hypothetical protein